MQGKFRRAIVLAIVFALAAASVLPVFAQDEDAVAVSSYVLPLPEGWEKLEYKDGAGVPRVEYIFRDRSDALLKIKRVRVSGGVGPSELAERDLEQVLRFQPGFVRGKTEAFSGGSLAGVYAQYDFSRGGRPMLGRNYYLQQDPGTVWVLQFTGDRKALRELRAVTDQMARAFKNQ